MVAEYMEDSNTQKSSRGFNHSEDPKAPSQEPVCYKRTVSNGSNYASSFPDNEEFTVPTVKMPDGTYIMDSLVIARELEKQYPSPDLQIDSPLRQRYADELSKSFGGLRAEFILRVPNILLKEVNHDYWHATRSQWVGMPLEKYVQENGGEKAYKAAAPFLQNITAMLKENDKGVFFLGDTISYVDFYHAGFLVMFRSFGDEVFDKILEASGDPEVHLKFLEALKPWIERDDH
ncbi:hypothetical protein O1611_g3921 [Lasiodiplodia mahajangana]|uniref:Uncharacterized protein n=1 Tax=Lasiodiplodia mahajangana TaxID=1108764 RepID=A0ACC2JQS4_9PEZI|nr:hypothetical protein O1611_g3921 [Lasiodiplodia mahajangana]